MIEKDPPDEKRTENDEIELNQDAIRDLDADDDSDDVRGGAPGRGGVCEGT